MRQGSRYSSIRAFNWTLFQRNANRDIPMAGTTNRADIYCQDGEAVPEKETQHTQYASVGDFLVYDYPFSDCPQ